MGYLVRQLGLQPYEQTWQAMQTFTDARHAKTPDELWVLEHDAIFTLGRASKPEHLLNTGDIPVLQIDRGGQVTYHGRGQLIIYLLIDLKRGKLGVKQLVGLMEQSIILFLADQGIQAELKSGAPGVYVGAEKIAALGLRIRKGCCFHGFSVNIDLDLAPFSRINPCGYAGLKVTSCQQLGVQLDMQTAANALTEHLIQQLSKAAL